MAGLISDALTLVACWLVIFGAFVLTYVALLAALRLVIEWQHRQGRRRDQAEVAAIDRDTEAALQGISAAFMAAQRHVRPEAARGHAPVEPEGSTTRRLGRGSA